MSALAFSYHLLSSVRKVVAIGELTSAANGPSSRLLIREFSAELRDAR